jgi:hypothetical protein
VILALALSLPSSATAAPVPLAQIGSSGPGAGQLNNPKGVAIDGVGNLYVVEQNNHRISVFGADGTFIRAFGWGVDTGAAAFEVCTTASTCQMGSAGGGVGQLNAQQGVATDCRGAVWVPDTGNHRLQRFGEPGTALPPCPAAAVVPPVVTPPAAVPSTLTGRRAAALKKCKKRFPKGPRRKKCIKKAKKLPA